MMRARSGSRRGVHIAALLSILLLAAACGEKIVSVEQLIEEAKQHREKGSHRAAIIQLKNAPARAPDNAEARYLLGMSYSDTVDFGSAEKELRRALEMGYDAGKVLPPLAKALLS